VCAPGAGFNPLENLSPCSLPVSCSLATSLVQSTGSTGCPFASTGPAWSSLAQDLHVSGRHVGVIGTIPLPDLGVRSASIVRICLSCLIDLNSDLYHLCASLYGLDTFWARGLPRSWINKETITTSHLPPSESGFVPQSYCANAPRKLCLSLLNLATTVLSKFRVRKWYTWASD